MAPSSRGYDAGNDQLVSASYGDGLADAAQSWSYDAAGNRASDSSQPGAWAYDNLNRILSSPQGSYTHDLLGNRLTGPGGAVHTWDALGRMTGLTKAGATTSYAYRADGMRVLKSSPSGSSLYRYDGQMGVETVDLASNGTVSAVERHGLGARGLDLIERTTQAGTTTGFPLYDAHGNDVATLTRSGTGWSVGDERGYDAWGRVRLGAAQGPPSARYCASLGHVQDDESGLVYMRARYYEASTGRFVSEDHGLDGTNWFVYAHNTPTAFRDASGKDIIGPNYGPVNAGLGLILVAASSAGQWVGKHLFESMYKNMIDEGRATKEGLDRVLAYWDSLAGTIFQSMTNAATGLTLGAVAISGPIGVWAFAGQMSLAAGASFMVGMMTTFSSLVMLDIIINWPE